MVDIPVTTEDIKEKNELFRANKEQLIKANR